MPDALEFTTNLALKVGDILLKYYDPSGIRATQKPDHTVVTEADLAADKLITQDIHENFPHDEIISEESSHVLEHSNSPVWVIDPLDGTTNFSLGLSVWGVSIARLVDGYPVIGVLFFPLLRELYTCKLGAGAFLNHLKIKAHSSEVQQHMSFFACCSRTYGNYNINIPYKARILGSGAYNFCMVARGSAILGFDAAAKIWDLAAGWLLVEEAGGKLSQFEGPSPFPISPGVDYSVINYPTLSAATTERFSFGKAKIQKKSNTGPVTTEDT